MSADYLLGMAEEFSAVEEIREIITNLLQLPPQERQLLAGVIRLAVRGNREERPVEPGAEG